MLHAPMSPYVSGLEQQARISGWGSQTMIAPIWGHFDESGEEDSGGALKRLTLGGFIAPWPEIERLCQRWREALDQECLASFHLKDIASDEHDYESWPEERKERLDKFVDILCDHANQFAAYTYKTQSKKDAFVTAYKPAIGRAMRDLETVCIDTGASGNMVFAQTKEISKELIGRFFDLAEWSDNFEGYGVRSSAKEPALQAAEIVARGMKQLMQDGLITHSFERLILTKKRFWLWPESPFGLSGPWRRGGGRK